jgi:hypothetical protein
MLSEDVETEFPGAVEDLERRIADDLARGREQAEREDEDAAPDGGREE